MCVRAKHLQVSSSNRERDSKTVKEGKRGSDNDSKKRPSTSTFLHEIKSHGSDAYKVGTKTKQSDAGQGQGRGRETGERQLRQAAVQPGGRW